MVTKFLLLINGGEKTMYVPIINVLTMEEAVKAGIDFYFKNGVTGARTMHVVEIKNIHDLSVEHLEALKEKGESGDSDT